jgi:hypothetical protein
MPHFWTFDGRKTDPAKIIQKDLAKWSYRNQVIAVEKMSPLALFTAVKLTEALFHLRPKSIKRFLFPGDVNYSKIYRCSIWAGLRVFIAELFEFIFDVRFSPRGSTKRIPGQPSSTVGTSPLSEGGR